MWPLCLSKRAILVCLITLFICKKSSSSNVRRAVLIHCIIFNNILVYVVFICMYPVDRLKAKNFTCFIVSNALLCRLLAIFPARYWTTTNLTCGMCSVSVRLLAYCCSTPTANFLYFSFPFCSKLYLRAVFMV